MRVTDDPEVKLSVELVDRLIRIWERVPAEEGEQEVLSPVLLRRLGLTEDQFGRIFGLGLFEWAKTEEGREWLNGR